MSRLLTPVRLVYCLTVALYGLAMLFLTGQVYYGQAIKSMISGIHWDIPKLELPTVDLPRVEFPSYDLGPAPRSEPTVLIGSAWQMAPIAAIPTATPTRTATPIPTKTPVPMLAYQGGPALSQLTALYPKEAHAWACANGPDYELWIYLTVRGYLLTREQSTLPYSQRAALPGSNPWDTIADRLPTTRRLITAVMTKDSDWWVKAAAADISLVGFPVGGCKS